MLGELAHACFEAEGWQELPDIVVGLSDLHINFSIELYLDLQQLFEDDFGLLKVFRAVEELSELMLNVLRGFMFQALLCLFDLITFFGVVNSLRVVFH